MALTGDATATNGALWLAPGADVATLSAAIVRDIPGGSRLDVAAPGEIRELSLKAFDRTFAVTYALELAAVVIGLFGLSSSFGALVLSRRREFGLLRHIGMTRRQIGAMLAAEGLTVSGIGLVIGLGLGWVISLDPDPRGQPAIVPLEHGAGVPWSCSARVCAARAVAVHVDGGRDGPAGDGARAILAVKEDW